MSQMDSDQFIPIWTIANMEGIKKLTTNMDLIVEVLRGMSKIFNVFVTFTYTGNPQVMSNP